LQQRYQLDRRERQARAIAALHAEGFRHQPIQCQPDAGSAHGECHEQPAPIQPLQHQGTDQRPEQGREQGDIGQQRHHPHGIGFAEGLVQGRITHRDHEAQADALEQTQGIEQADVMRPIGRQARRAEERAARQQQGSSSIAVGQRADQPLQDHAAEQVQVQRMGNVFGAGLQVGDDHRHGWHDGVAGQVGQQFEQGQDQAKGKRPGGRNVEKRGHDGLRITDRVRRYAGKAGPGPDDHGETGRGAAKRAPNQGTKQPA